MIALRKNLVHNPRFTLWPWGTSGFAGVSSSVNYGKTAARWFLQTTSGGGDVVSVSRGTNASTTKYDKFLRGRANLTLDITSLATDSAIKIRQFLDGAQDFGQNFLAVTIMASGPAGAHFYFGAGESMAKIITEGNDADGDPVIVTSTFFAPFDEPIYDYLRIRPFERPSQIGTYRLHFMQVEPLMSPMNISGLEIRSDSEEWRLIERYITPIRQGMIATGASTTQVRIPVAAPPGGWRTTPVIPTEGRASSVSMTLNSGGTVITAATPTFGFATNPAENTMGAVVVVGGLSGAASASQYVVGPHSDSIAYLNADFF